MRGAHAMASSALAVLAVLTGCTGRSAELVDVPTTRTPAPVVTLTEPARCPSDTVLLDDTDPASGAGAVPDGFDGRVVLRCEVEYSTMVTTAGRDRFTVRQWRAPLSAELVTALALPDRELDDDGSACAVARDSTTALYLVDVVNRAVRVLPPTDAPCGDLRPEVEALLPDSGAPPDRTLTVSRPSG